MNAGLDRAVKAFVAAVGPRRTHSDGTYTEGLTKYIVEALLAAGWRPPGGLRPHVMYPASGPYQLTTGRYVLWCICGYETQHYRYPQLARHMLERHIEQAATRPGTS